MIKYAALATVAALALSGCNKTPDAPAASNTPVAATATPAPAGGDWASSVTETADGGYLRGNPAAATKLIEYGALSCPHCAHFAKESHDEMGAMIASGKLSYELRPFLVHPQLDLAATLLATCNGPATFFPLADQIFAHQDDWMGAEKFKLLTPEVQKSWAALTPNQLAADVANRLGLVTFVAQRGVSVDKAKSCLADKARVDKLTAMMQVADSQYHVTGTPTFVLNGAVVPETNDWEKLKPRLKAVIGG